MSTATENLVQSTEALPAHDDGAKPLTPVRAGGIGAALGLGVGLLFGELIVPGVIIAAAGVLGLAAVRKHLGHTAKA
jgi:hypothetical protein